MSDMAEKYVARAREQDALLDAPSTGAATGVAQPGVPAPYRAMLAICSDLDETPDGDTYFETMRFLNTTEETRMGTGVGLEVGNTMYFDMPPGHFAYWNEAEATREKIRALIRSGHIDCLHSFGDLATTRAHAGRALDELSRHGCQFKVWIDHAQAITNFGADIMCGMGDLPGHAAYHADLTLDHGIEYIWRGRVTSVIGQDRPFSLRGLVTPKHLGSSLVTVAKEASKQVLARSGNPKYGLHAGNRLAQMEELRDGRQAPEFIRCNPSWGGVSCHDRGDGIDHVLNRRYLDRLTTRGGYSILYTHLGKLEQGPDKRSFSPSVVAAFRLLASYQQAGKILVTTTARLLEHACPHSSLRPTPAQEATSGPRSPWARLSFPAI